MQNNISKIQDKCTGCLACIEVCPHKLISCQNNEEGFLQPVVNNSKCINCGKCLNVCPAQTCKQKEEYIQKGFVSYSNDKKTYNNSASGGIFAELAKLVISKKGVAFGAAFINLEVRHIKIDKIEDIKMLQKSKYVQSNTQGIYNECKKELEKNKLVLFSGTPCQISALNNFLNKKYDNLITCDLVCHGVPSQETFDKYIEYENRKKSGKINKFEFRYKTKRKSSTHTFRYEMQKNKKTICKTGNYYESPFLLGFQKHVFLRKSCYTCDYANMNRISDITLGDFWNISNQYKKEKGISMIIINTFKGEKYLNLIRNNIFLEEMNIQFIKNSNACLNKPTSKNPFLLSNSFLMYFNSIVFSFYHIFFNSFLLITFLATFFSILGNL